MVSGEIHYEIHVKPAKGIWKFRGAIESREEALKQAEFLVSEGYSVRVNKETKDSTDGTFRSAKVFHAGDADFIRNQGKIETDEPLPCFKPQDLYSFDARKNIGILLQDSLNHWRITPLELLHSASNLERLESTGTVLQAAVQKIAIAQARATEGSVAERVKNLHKLVSDGMKGVYIDRTKNRLPVLEGTDITSLAKNLSINPRREYLFNAAITEYLANSPEWNTKLDRILTLMRELPEDPHDRLFCLTCIDGFVSEIMSASAAIKDLLGPQPNLGSALQSLTELFCGKLAPDLCSAPGVGLLNDLFAEGQLPEARTSVARRVLKEIEGAKRLMPDSLEAEVKTLRKLATQMMLGCGNLIPHEEILNAFRARSERLISTTTLETYLGEAKNTIERADKILFLGENIVGAESKRKLTGILQEIITSPAFRDVFVTGEKPIALRLRLLASLQEKIYLSEVDEQVKLGLMDHLDGICVGMMTKSKLLTRVSDGQDNPLNKSLALLKLIASGILTRGLARQQAQSMAIDFMGQPGVLNNYLTSDSHGDMLTKLEELKTLLRESGIEPEAALTKSAA